MIRSGHDFWAKLSTGEWQVIVSYNRGLCLREKSIVILHHDYNTKDYLDTLCHECVHASMPDASEAAVARLANDLSEVLWKRGYRLPTAPRKRRGRPSA